MPVIHSIEYLADDLEVWVNLGSGDQRADFELLLLAPTNIRLCVGDIMSKRLGRAQCFYTLWTPWRAGLRTEVSLAFQCKLPLWNPGEEGTACFSFS